MVYRKGFKAYLFLFVWIFLLLAGGKVAESATLYETSRQKLHSRLAAVPREPYTFVVLGDNRGNDAVFIKCLIAAARFQPLFIMHVGDVVHSGSAEQFEHFLSTVQRTVPEIPIFVAIGNHELTDKDRTDKGKALFQQVIGPLDYSLELPEIDIELIVLDSSGYVLTPQQIDYLGNRLQSKSSRKFVFTHIPPRTRKWIDDHTFTEGADAFLRLIADRKPAGVFYGHYHLYDEDTFSGVRHIITGGAGAPLLQSYFGDSSYHIVVVRVAGGNVATEKVVISIDQPE